MNFLPEPDSKATLIQLLTQLGVKPGSVIYIAADISGLPLPAYKAELTRAAVKEREQKWCDFVLNTILEYLGPEGTLLAGAFSYNCSRPGSVFTVEETPSEIGPIPEALRRHPGAIRSVHPIFSVCGIGKHAKDILQNTGRAAFGARSPFAAMNAYSADFVCLGTRVSHMMTYIHHLEQTYGCNNRYHKAFDCTVMKDGQEQTGPWLAYMAYRSVGTSMQCQTLEERLIDENVMRQTTYGKAPYQAIHIDALNDVGYRMLDENPSAFMEKTVIIDLDESESMKSPSADSRVTLKTSCS